MGRYLYFITHPNVVISRDVPVPRWPLSETGRERMKAALAQPWIKTLTSLYCSTEQKAIDGATILAEHLSLPYTAVEALGENDRSSTGVLPAAEFESTADAFFAHPETSVRGWERACDAQARIVRAVTLLAEKDHSTGSVAVVGHGGVGTLLYCHFSGHAIARQWDQPRNNGGNYCRYPLPLGPAPSGWKPIDA
jgi:broad specificity phosphatase PhoE